MYSQVYWTRNNPIDLPPELVNSIGRKLFNLFPGKILCKKRQDLTWKISREEIFSENKYFQRWKIFRKEFFQVKRFQGKVMAITGYEVDQVVLNHRPSPSTNQGRQHIIFAPQRNISKVTHTGDEKIKADSENSNEAGLSGFACYPDCSQSDKSVNKIP